jgi:hypothetical protein
VQFEAQTWNALDCLGILRLWFYDCNGVIPDRISLYFGNKEILMPNLFRLWHAICGTSMECIGLSGLCK